MGKPRRRLPLLTAAVSLAALALPSMAAADSTTQLPFPGLGQIAVDQEHGRVFVSSGASQTSIVVLSFNGAIVKTITGQQVPKGMFVDEATDTLYVALEGASSISKINTVTLTEVGRLPTAPLDAPVDVALAGGRIWFSHDCQGGGVGSMALDGSDVQNHSTDFPGYCPTFATSPADPDILVSGDIGISPTTVYVHDVSTPTPTLLVSERDPGLGTSNLRQLEVTPDGQKVLVASGAPSSIQSLLLSNLSLVTSFPTNRSGRAVAVTADGSHVAGAASPVSSEENLFVFSAADSSSTRDWDFGGDVAFSSVAFSNDESRLFAVSENPATDLAEFHVLTTPTVPRVPTTLSLSVSRSSVSYNKSVTLTAKFGGAAAGQTVTFYTDPVSGSKTAVASGIVNGAGIVSRTVKVKGKTTFTAKFTGDAAYEPVTSAGRIVNVRALTTVAFNRFYRRAGAYRLYRLGKFPTLAGRVTPNHAGTLLRFVGQVKTRRGWRTFDSGRYPIGPGGAANVIIRARARGNYRVRAIFAGDSDHLGSTSAWAYARIT